MKLDVLNLESGKAGSIDLDETVFGLEPRADHFGPGDEIDTVQRGRPVRKRVFDAFYHVLARKDPAQDDAFVTRFEVSVDDTGHVAEHEPPLLFVFEIRMNTPDIVRVQYGATGEALLQVCQDRGLAGPGRPTEQDKL